MCSRGEAVFEVAAVTGEAVVVITADVVGAVTVLVEGTQWGEQWNGNAVNFDVRTFH